LGAFSLEQLAALGIITVAKKPGKIVSQQKCRVCGTKGKYEIIAQDDIRAMVCSVCGKFQPTLFEVRIFWDGSHQRILYNAQGERLSTLEQADAARGEIRRQIKTGEFNPAYWTAASKNELVWETFLTGYL
jgi:CDGSH-type Zn-finger protein